MFSSWFYSHSLPALVQNYFEFHHSDSFEHTGFMFPQNPSKFFYQTHLISKVKSVIKQWLSVTIITQMFNVKMFVNWSTTQLVLIFSSFDFVFFFFFTMPVMTMKRCQSSWSWAASGLHWETEGSFGVGDDDVNHNRQCRRWRFLQWKCCVWRKSSCHYRIKRTKATKR